jgi:tRNA A37 threonylcarbamoyladenosine synthetase subunit TsaC/SUA5/YrdC
MSKTKTNIIIIVAVLLVILVPAYIQDINAREDSVDACERGNVGVREPLYQFLIDAQQTRLAQASAASSKKEQAINEQAAKNYQNSIDDMINAASDVAAEEGSPIVDCKKAYPLPPPASWFTD